MQLDEAKRILNNNGYILKETHAEDDILDWLGDIFWKFTEENGVEWHSDWKTSHWEESYIGYKLYTKLDGKDIIVLIDKNGKIQGGMYNDTVARNKNDLASLIQGRAIY